MARDGAAGGALLPGPRSVSPGRRRAASDRQSDRAFNAARGFAISRFAPRLFSLFPPPSSSRLAPTRRHHTTPRAAVPSEPKLSEAEAGCPTATATATTTTHDALKSYATRAYGTSCGLRLRGRECERRGFPRKQRPNSGCSFLFQLRSRPTGNDRAARSPIAAAGGALGRGGGLMEPYASPEGGGGSGEGGTDTGTGLEESMWSLGLGGTGEAAAAGRLPERPGEANCVYYLRTGACGYGEGCRYNHPRDRTAAFNGVERTTRTVEYPERPGQPLCEYYMKNGTCKFGSNCKYNHPREGASVQPVVLNASGYPLRPGEKECSYYTKTGHCKFGSTCKFHHPDGPELGVASETPSIYPPVQPLAISSPLSYPPLAGWQMGRPSVLPGSYFPGSYPPMMHPSGVIPMQGWNPYISPMNQVAPAGGQQTFQGGPFYGLSHQGPSTAVTYGSNYAPLSSSTWPSSSNKHELVFPERPGQPECHHYVKTGTCKFGATCKYNHPRNLSMPKSNCMLSPIGLPIRPGAQPCVYYSQHGFCKFGPTCKFDHPLSTLSYSPSVSSLTDVPIAPYPLSFPVAPVTPSPSSSVLRPEYILGQDSSVNQPSSPGTSFGPSGPISKIFAPHTLFVRPPTSTTGGTVTSHGGGL